MSADAVTTQIRDGVLVATLDRRPADALGVPIMDGLAAALDAADRSPEVRTFVVASAVPRFFAAGADIKHMASIGAAGFAAHGDRLRGVLDRLAGSDRITIAAVEGRALGGGMELAMACTLRVAGAGALDEGSRVEAAEVNGRFSRGEGREGIAAFLEKRTPKFGS